jgi:hypothetical protein
VAVVVNGSASDHQGMADPASGHDRERDGGFPPELGGDGPPIGVAAYFRLFSTERL